MDYELRTPANPIFQRPQASSRLESMIVRIAILWSHLSGYFSACLRALIDTQNVEFIIWDSCDSHHASFAGEIYSWMGQRRHPYQREADVGEIWETLCKFVPDALLVTSWYVPTYRKICRLFSGRCVRICCMDNQWLGTLRQFIGITVASRYIRPLYEGAFVPGKRQRSFARMLGFTDAEIFEGLYSCDHPRYEEVYHKRTASYQAPGSKFLFVGRLIKEKGIRLLADAYQQYRSQVPDPWPLMIAGEGPLRSLLAEVEGVRFLGFVQPYQLPSVFSQAGCVILPSAFEPWGVVVHEATSAGLAVICTARCGSSAHLVRDGKNGFILDDLDPAALAQLLKRYSMLSDAERMKLGEESIALSQEFTPTKWANTVIRAVYNLKSNKGSA